MLDSGLLDHIARNTETTFGLLDLSEEKMRCQKEEGGREEGQTDAGGLVGVPPPCAPPALIQSPWSAVMACLPLPVGVSLRRRTEN